MDSIEVATDIVEFDLAASPIISPRPSYALAYFGGPLFISESNNLLEDFYSSVRTPFEILQDQNRRKGLEEVIGLISPTPTLFNSPRDVGELLDEMAIQGHLYQRFSKKVGKKDRNFSVPQGSFKDFLKDYVIPFIKTIKVHPRAHGGEKGWSVIDSLSTHLPVRSSMCFDMKSAFNQAEINYVFDFFYKNLDGKASGLERIDTAGFLASLCTVREREDHVVKSGELVSSSSKEYYRASLPQGSSFSMSLFNRMMFPIDVLLTRYSKNQGLNYTRWVDDFIFTCPKRKNFGAFEKTLRLAQNYVTLAPNKVFYTNGTPSYLLGHKLSEDKIVKVSRAELEEKRVEPLEGVMLSNTHPRGEYLYYSNEEDLDLGFEGENNDSKREGLLF